MAENKLGIGRFAWPSNIDNDLKIALEDLVFRLDDNISYLMKPRVKSVTTTYTATDLDSVILADATGGVFTVTLPDATIMQGKILSIKRTSASNTVTVAGTIDGSVNYSLDSQNKFVQVVSDGTSWKIISNN